MGSIERLRMCVEYFYEKGLLSKDQLDLNSAEEHFRSFKYLHRDLFNSRSTRKLKNNLYYLNKVNVFIKENDRYLINKEMVDRIIGDRDYWPQTTGIVVVSQNVSLKPQPRQDNLIDREGCLVCDEKFNSDQIYNKHVNSLEHELRMEYHKNKKQFLENKDVVVELEEGVGNESEDIVVRPEKNHLFTVYIKNESKTEFTIKRYMQLSYVLEVSLNKKHLPSTVKPGKTVELYVNAHFTELKSETYILVLVLENVKTRKVLYALKTMVFHVLSDLMDGLLPVSPYKRPSRAIIKELNEDVISGPRLKRQTFSKKLPLQWFPLPKAIIAIINSGFKYKEGMSEQTKVKLEEIKKLLKTPDPKRCLVPSNYYEMLKFLLYAEEHQMLKDIHDYDMVTKDLQPTKSKHYYRLEVPGLVENRPSVILGDVITAKLPEGKIKYEGVVHAIEQTSVILAFDPRFSVDVYEKGVELHFTFSFSRYPLKVEHQAIQLANNHQIIPFLFPKTKGNNVVGNTSFTYFNSNIDNNLEQKQAVKHIFYKTAYPAPYLLFGPPGTGKTFTIIEAINQIRFHEKGNVLVCAPSNSASNEIAQRLIKTIPKTDLFRYYANSCSYNEIPESLKPYSNYKNNCFYYPKLEDICKYKIVVSTATNAAKLVNAGINPSHFGYVFIDEAGNCTETESLIPIAGILSSSKDSKILGQIVLAGDPRQLGPIIHSPLCKEYGFETSMLERLMDNIEIYQRGLDGTYNKNVLTKLVNNYRSHPTIIKVPNNLFYDDELKAKGDDIINTAIGWEHLKNSKVPIIFHNIKGKDLREGSSPSWFNLVEVEMVLHYVACILDSRFKGRKILQENIGVITPYRQQCSKLRKVFEKKRWDNIDVGSVEKFQGTEKLVIIISTVRSNDQFTQVDHKYHLGFLKNKKRFNVAITRAKALLIVIGNGSLLQKDPTWFKFLEFCDKNSCIAGQNLVLDAQPDPIEELTINLDNLNLEQGSKSDQVDFSRGNI